MSFMFDGCNNLTNIDFDKFNISKVKNMHCMFYNCQMLKKIFFQHLNNNEKPNIVYDISSMFSGCNALEEIDISNFLYKSENDGAIEENLINNCTKLKQITIHNNVNNQLHVCLSSIFKKKDINFEVEKEGSIRVYKIKNPENLKLEEKEYIDFCK